MFLHEGILYDMEISIILKFICKFISISVEILIGFIFQLDIIQKFFERINAQKYTRMKTDSTVILKSIFHE